MPDTPPVNQTRTTFRLMYRSRDRVPAEDRGNELGALFASSRSNNEKRDITGALLLTESWFVQVLEGDEVAVRSLFATIQADPRHDRIELLFEGPADDRVFAHWSMAKIAMSDSDIPLNAQISEISPVSHRDMTPEKTRLVEVMRAAVETVPA
jgi:hypothetical protein